MAEHSLQMQSGQPSSVHGVPPPSSLPPASRDPSTAAAVAAASVLPGYFNSTPGVAAPGLGSELGSSLYHHQESSAASLSSPGTPSAGPLYVPTTHAPVLQNPVTPYPPAATPTQRPVSMGGSGHWPSSNDCSPQYSSYSSGPSQSYPSALSSWPGATEPRLGTDSLHRATNGLSPFTPYMGSPDAMSSWGNYAQGLSLAAQGIQYPRTGMGE